MEPYLPLLFLVVLLLAGVPIAFSLGGAGVIGVWMVTGQFSSAIGLLWTTLASTVTQQVLTTIPMFILMAFLASSGGLADDLFDTASAWLSSVRGGLAIATVFACIIFGAMSGVSLAAASVMSKIAMPNMRRHGYSDTLAAGAIGIGSTLDILIPPSVPMVVYGIMTGTPIGKMLIAGIIPGLVLAVFLALTIMVWVTIKPSHAPKTQVIPWGERLRSMYRVWPSLLLITLVTVALYTGIATATEVGAMGALMALLIGLGTRRLTRKGLIDSLVGTVRSTAMIFMILIGGMIFGYYIALSQVPQHIISAIIAMKLRPYLVVFGIIVVYFIISMFMDELPLMLITLQLTFPLIVLLKIDPIWYGVITMMMIAMGLVFPPVGMAAFVVAATGKVEITKVYKGTSILMVSIVLTTILLFIFPQIATWLPATME